MWTRSGLNGGWLLFLLVSLVGCNGSPPATTKPGGSETQAPSGPRLEATTTLDLGEVKLGEQYAHSFKIANRGGQPLTLRLVRKSCDCTDVQLEPATIAPGKEGKVTLAWAPRPDQDGKKQLTVQLETNDPDHEKVELVLRAEVNQPIRISTAHKIEVFFEPFPRDIGPVPQLVTVFSTVYPEFKLKATLEKNVPGLTIVQSPLLVTVVDDIPNVKSGYRVRIGAMPKIAEGFFQDTLVLEFTPPGQKSQTVKLPVSGTVKTTSVTFRPSEVEFRHLMEPDSKKILVQFREPLPAKEEVNVLRCDPSFIQASEPKRVGGGLWEITLQVPKDHPDAMTHQLNGFLRGFIELQTSASPTPVKVRLKWDAH
jgi:hypothetical protein